MKPKRCPNKIYGLRARLGLSLLISGVICVAVFFGMYFASDVLLTEVFSNSSFEARRLQRQIDSLQDYIQDESITVDTLDRLKKWERKQPLILLELYQDGACIYSSTHSLVVANGTSELDEESEPYEYHLFHIYIQDEPLAAVLYSDFTSRYYVLNFTASLVLSLVLFVLLFLRSNSKLIDYLCKLNAEVQIIESGNLDYPVSIQGNDEVTDLAESMDRMKDSFREQLKREQALYQANRQLVTEMSHDLRTPLTSLMLYTEILRTHRYESNEQMEEYLEKIDAKAHHLKTLTDHLFEYSLKGSDQKPQEPVTLEQSMSKPLADLVYDLKAHGFTVMEELDWQPRFVQTKAEYVRRIMENIGSNIIKYAAAEAPVRIETIYQDGHCGLAVCNACVPDMAEAIGKGIGLENIRVLMQQMHGICTVEQTEAAFALTLLFPEQ